MISRKNRFHGYGSLKRVYRNSKNVRSTNIGLRYAKRIPNKPYRAAVVVGKKVHKSAVKRNKVRRRIYEIVRNSENVPEATDLVFTVFSEQVIELSSEELNDLINNLLIKTTQA